MAKKKTAGQKAAEVARLARQLATEAQRFERLKKATHAAPKKKTTPAKKK